MHLVLARPEGAQPGTKGLSLFLVPKFHFDPETGEPGERNGAFVTNVEHKMGLNASATCEVTFGGNGVPATGWLLGEVHDGIAQMFQVIEYARMMVGTKAIGTLSTGYLRALEYAKERIQGADLTQQTNKAAPRVPITNHPDVRRSLHAAEGLRRGPARGVHVHRRPTRTTCASARRRTPSAAPCRPRTIALAEKVNDLLLPIVKGVGSERASEQLIQSLQTLGGSGYLQDYPIEQYIRDAKIDSLYEGTTAIQAQDFFFRKIVKDNGQALMHVAGLVQAFLEQRGRQRPAQGGARVPRDRARRRPGHARHDDRLPDLVAGGHHQPLQGRPARGQVPDERRRHAHRLPAAARRRGRHRRARRGADGQGHGRSTRARSPSRGSSPATCCRS